MILVLLPAALEWVSIAHHAAVLCTSSPAHTCVNTAQTDASECHFHMCPWVTSWLGGQEHKWPWGCFTGALWCPDFKRAQCRTTLWWNTLWWNDAIQLWGSSWANAQRAHLSMNVFFFVYTCSRSHGVSMLVYETCFYAIQGDPVKTHKTMKTKIKTRGQRISCVLCTHEEESTLKILRINTNGAV